MAGAVASECCSCFTIVGWVCARSTLLRGYATLHTVVRLAQKSVFLWACSLFLLPSSYLRMLGGKSCMSGYSYLTCRQCHNATVAVANNSGLPSHARTRNCLCYSLLSVSRNLSTLAVVSMYCFCFFKPLNCFWGFPCARTENLSVVQANGKGTGNKALSLVHLLVCNIDWWPFTHIVLLLLYSSIWLWRDPSCIQTLEGV